MGNLILNDWEIEELDEDTLNRILKSKSFIALLMTDKKSDSPIVWFNHNINIYELADIFHLTETLVMKHSNKRSPILSKNTKVSYDK